MTCDATWDRREHESCHECDDMPRVVKMKGEEEA